MTKAITVTITITTETAAQSEEILELLRETDFGFAFETQVQATLPTKE